MSNTAAQSRSTTTVEADGLPAATLTPFARRALAVARIALGWVFLWDFLDKTFGLGYATPAGDAWLDGASPTSGYLASREGPLGEFFNAMSGQAWADWLFMGGMAGLGVALVAGVGLRVAAGGAAVLLGMLWLSALPPQNNPFMDQHLIYLTAAVVLAAARAGDTWGLGRAWGRTGLVRAMPWLR